MKQKFHTTVLKLWQKNEFVSKCGFLVVTSKPTGLALVIELLILSLFKRSMVSVLYHDIQLTNLRYEEHLKLKRQTLMVLKTSANDCQHTNTVQLDDQIRTVLT